MEQKSQELTEKLKRVIADKQSATIFVVGTGISLGATQQAAAGWGGLLRSGLVFCKENVPDLDPKWEKKVSALIRHGTSGSADLQNASVAAPEQRKTRSLIKAANAIVDQLCLQDCCQGGRELCLYKRWLDGSIGELTIADSEVLKVLGRYADTGVLLTTTNYDNLLSEQTGLEHVTWLDHEGVLGVIRKHSGPKVIHWHGHYTKPHSLVFGDQTYHNIRNDEAIQAILNAVGLTLTIVFIGCGGGGLNDPNVGHFLSYITKLFGAAVRHYILTSKHDWEELSGQFPEESGFHVISYGDHTDLAKYLLEVFPVRLPSWPTPFIGRSDELNQVASELFKTRLLILRGVSGSGKSRLAAEVARTHLDDYPDGVYWVPLGASSEAESLREMLASSPLSAIALALGLKTQQEAVTQELLIDFLRDKQLLLVLDGCDSESVLRKCRAIVEDLWQPCPGIHTLVTSQFWEDDPLAQEGLIHVVAGLGWPEEGIVTKESAHRTADQWRELLSNHDATRLFLQLAEPNIEDVLSRPAAIRDLIRVCRTVQGIPFELELTARALCAPDLHLDIGRIADAVEEYGTIPFVFSQLSPFDQRLLESFSVFQGGWTLSGAEAVCAVQDISPSILARSLLSLADKALISTIGRDGGAPSRERYRLPDTVRAFVTARMNEESDELRAVAAIQELRQRHAAFYLRLVESVAHELPGPMEAVYYSQLQTEHDNLKAALAYFETDVARALRMVNSLWRFWDVRGHRVDGTKFLKETLKAAEEAEGRRLKVTPPIALRTDPLMRLRADALNGLGILLREQGKFEEAKPFFMKSLTRREALNDKADIAATWNDLGVVEKNLGNYSDAAVYFAHALQLRQEVGNQLAIAATMNNLGVLRKDQGNYKDSRDLHEQARVIYESIGADRGLAAAWSNLGESWVAECAYDNAEACYQRSLDIRLRLDDDWGIAWNYLNQGHLARYRGDDARGKEGEIALSDEALNRYAQAWQLYERSSSAQRKIGDRRGLAYSIGDLGLVALKLGRLDEATQKMREALEMRRQLRGKQAIIRSIEGFAELSHAKGKDRLSFILYELALYFRNCISFVLPKVDESDYDALPCVTEKLNRPQRRSALKQKERLKAKSLDDAIHQICEHIMRYA